MLIFLLLLLLPVQSALVAPTLYCLVPDYGCDRVVDKSRCSAWPYQGCRADGQGGCEPRPECAGKTHACMWKSLTLEVAQRLVPQCLPRGGSGGAAGNQLECASQRAVLADNLGISSFCQQQPQVTPPPSGLPPTPQQRLPLDAFYNLEFFVHPELGADNPLISGLSRTKPFQTLAYAVERSRQVPSAVKRKITLMNDGGRTFRLTSTLQLTEVDSNLTIEGEHGAVVAGSVAVGLQWRPHHAGVYVATLPSLVARQLGPLSALFVDGQPMIRARFPNVNLTTSGQQQHYHSSGLSEWASSSPPPPLTHRQQIRLRPSAYGSYYSARGGACTHQFVPPTGYFCEPNSEAANSKAQCGTGYSIPTRVSMAGSLAAKFNAAAWATHQAPPVYLHALRHTSNNNNNNNNNNRSSTWTFELTQPPNTTTTTTTAAPTKQMNLADLLAWQNFYLATNGHTWTALSEAYFDPCAATTASPLPPKPLRTVECELKYGKLVITAIALPNNNLRGVLGEWLSYLTSLRKLDLGNNPHLASGVAASCSSVCSSANPLARQIKPCNLANTGVKTCTAGGPTAAPSMLPTTAQPTTALPIATVAPSSSSSFSTPFPTSAAPTMTMTSAEYEYEFEVPRTRAPAVTVVDDVPIDGATDDDDSPSFPTGERIPPAQSLQATYCSSGMTVKSFTQTTSEDEDENRFVGEWDAASQTANATTTACWMLVPSSALVLRVQLANVAVMNNNGALLHVYTLQTDQSGVAAAVLESPATGGGIITKEWELETDRTVLIVLSGGVSRGSSPSSFTADVSVHNPDCAHGRQLAEWPTTATTSAVELAYRHNAVTAPPPRACFCFELPLAVDDDSSYSTFTLQVPAGFSASVKKLVQGSSSETLVRNLLPGTAQQLLLLPTSAATTPSSLLIVFRHEAHESSDVAFSSQFTLVPPPTNQPTTRQPTTLKPTRLPTTLKPTPLPTTLKPTPQPTTLKPTLTPTTPQPTQQPTELSTTTDPLLPLSRRQLSSDDTTTTTLTLFRGGFQDARGDCGQASSDASWFVENALVLLDSPGEFFLHGDQLYLYLPAAAQSLTTARIELTLPSTRVLIRAVGSDAAPVTNLRIRGIHFQHTYATHMDAAAHEIPSGGDWTVTRQAAVVLENALQCDVQHNRFAHLGGHGVLVSKSASRVAVTHNSFNMLGASAVMLVGDPLHDDAVTAFDRRNSRHHSHVEHVLVGHNVMSNLGLAVKQSSGVFLSIAKHVLVTRNVVFNCPSAGFTVNDGYGGNVSLAANVAFNTDGPSVHVWDRQQWLEDDGKLPFSISRNLLHGGGGVDLDDGARNYAVEGNVVFDGLIKLTGAAAISVANNLVFPRAVACYWVKPPLINRVTLRDNTCVSSSLLLPAYLFDTDDANEAKRICHPTNLHAQRGNAYWGVASKWRACGEDELVTFSTWQRTYAQDAESSSSSFNQVRPTLEAELRMILNKLNAWV